MQIAFRVDSSKNIGIGHLIRCRSLAIHLREKKNKITFFCKNHFGNSNKLIINDKFELVELKVNRREKSETNTQKWLGSSQVEDANDVLKKINNFKYDWMIVDHYSISRKWHKIIKKKVKKVMVIDDNANKKYFCDIILNQNYYINYRNLYKNKIQENTKYFLGPSYALLDKSFYRKKNNKKKLVSRAPSLFLYFGGEDNFNLTRKVILASMNTEVEKLKLNIVLPQNLENKLKRELSHFSKLRGNIKFFEPRRSIARIMSKSDFALGAGGSTLWERIFIGIPSIVISTAKNQESACNALDKSKLIKYIGRAENININQVIDEIKNLISNKKKIKIMKKNMRLLKVSNNLSSLINAIK